MGNIKNFFKEYLTLSAIGLSILPNLPNLTTKVMANELTSNKFPVGNETEKDISDFKLSCGPLELALEDDFRINSVGTNLNIDDSNNFGTSLCLSLNDEKSLDSILSYEESSNEDNIPYKINEWDSELLESIFKSIDSNNFTFEEIKKYLDEKNINLSSLEKIELLKAFDASIYQNYNYESYTESLSKSDINKILKNAQSFYLGGKSKSFGVCRDYSTTTANFAIRVLDMNAVTLTVNNHSVAVVKDKEEEQLYVIFEGRVLSSYDGKEIMSKEDIDLAFLCLNLTPNLFSTIQDPISDKPIYVDFNNLSGFLQEEYNFIPGERFENFIKEGSIGQPGLVVEVYESDVSRFEPYLRSMQGINVSGIKEFGWLINNASLENDLFLDLGFSQIDMNLGTTNILEDRSLSNVLIAYINPCMENYTKLSFKDKGFEFGLGNSIGVFSSETLHTFYEQIGLFAFEKYYQQSVMGMTSPFLFLKEEGEHTDKDLWVGVKIYPANGCCNYLQGLYIPFVGFDYKNRKLGLKVSGSAEFQRGSSLIKMGLERILGEKTVISISSFYEHYNKILGDMNFRDRCGLDVDLKGKCTKTGFSFHFDDGNKKHLFFDFEYRF